MSQLKLIIGNKNYSSWSLRPWVFMQHMGIKFEEIRIPLFTATTDQQLSDYWSDSKVPVLTDGELIVWDSLAIMEYINEQYCDNKGWPSEPKLRALARSMCAEMHSSFTHLRNEMPMNCRRDTSHIKPSTNAQADIQRIMDLWRYCKSLTPQGEWLFGDYSIADAMFAPVALRFHGFKTTLDETAQQYVTSTINHPSIKQWVESGIAEKETINLDEL